MMYQQILLISSSPMAVFKGDFFIKLIFIKNQINSI